MVDEQPVNILLVDDRPENLLALESILSDQEHNLVKASSGAEALKCLLRDDFAVILLDVQMPGLDGFETAELIRGRARSQNTPIIFLTALDRSEAGVFRGYSVGAVDFLFKPIVPAVLRSKVNVFVDLYRKTDQLARQTEQLEQRVRERTADLLVVNETLRAEIAERKRAQETLLFLAEATTVLVSSLNYEDTLANLTRLAVPRLGDWSAVYMRDEHEQVRLVAVEHRDPTQLPLAWAIDERFPLRVNSGEEPGETFHTGRSVVVTEIGPAADRYAGSDGEYGGLLQALGATSYMAVPLRVHQQVLGVMVFALTQSQQLFGPADLHMAEELAHRAALAVENAILYRDAQRALRIRDDFVSVAAHELKTPITAIVGHTQLLQRRTERDGTLNERDQRALQTLNGQALRLSQLIHAVLDLSRLQAGQLAIKRQAVDVRTLVERVVEETGQTVERHRLNLLVDDGPILIEGDDLRLEQVIQNLLQNAIKYSPEGGLVQIGLRQQADQAELTVSDQGIGIPVAALQHLFTRFYRAENVEATAISGMGIGLYVVHEIVALHGGVVEVQSVEGEGSTFTVRLPLLAVPVAAERYDGS